jgi:flagellin
MLAKSIERLSSGQKINRGADGPASLVMSEGLRAQVASLQQATENNESAISTVQTAEGALNEVSRLLIDMRQRTVAAANVGVNDQNMVTANQKEIESALSSIDRISNNTQFGGEKLLNGSQEDPTQRNLTFQIGANQGQTASVALPNVITTELAKGAQNENGFSSLADVDVTTSDGAKAAMSMIDEAISQVAMSRGDMGAFQKNTLESNLTSLRVATENLTAAESNIRDADVAVELAAFTRNQIMTQSATAQLAQANAMPQNVTRLLSAQ